MSVKIPKQMDENLNQHPRILFIGDSAGKLNVNQNVPFYGTPSYKKLMLWAVKDLGLFHERITLMNQCDIISIDKHQIGSYVRYLFVNKWNSAAPYSVNNQARVIVLGKKAAAKLRSLGFEDFFELPHPSGLNLKLNDEKYVDKVLKECKNWIWEDRNVVVENAQ